MKKYIFCIKTKLDIKKVALATLKRVYSDTVVPRVLINSHIDSFIKHTNGTIFLCQIDLPQNKFKSFVHDKNYDLGLFFYSDLGKNYVKIIDGTGRFACSRTVNIFLDIFLKDKNQLKIENNLLKKQLKTKKISKKIADLSY